MSTIINLPVGDFNNGLALVPDLSSLIPLEPQLEVNEPTMVAGCKNVLDDVIKRAF